MTSYFKIARFDHWIKQCFIIPGAWLAWVMTSNENYTIKYLLFGLLATSFAASANYVINEWLDAEFDKYHPIKKYRPCVTKRLNAKLVFLEYAIFSILAIGLSTLINQFVLFAIVLLLVMGILYNVRPFRTKDVPFLDTLSESLNNAIRFAIGWFCIAPGYYPPLSFEMGYWMAGAFLMAAKRFAEYRMINNPELANLYRKSFAGYTELRLLLMTVFYGFLSIFFCGVFLIKYKIELLLVIPLICILFCYYLRICYLPDSAAQKPEKLFREKWLMILVISIIILVVLLLSIRIPQLDIFLRTDLVRITS